ncbi:MAG: DUF58 domain-containing protein, partial [Candidatus Dadabacteria bacterium]
MAPALGKTQDPYKDLISSERLKELRKLELATRRTIDSDFIGRYKTAFRGTGLIFSDLREYQPGDDIRDIHWKATARTGKTFVKTYQEERQLNVMIALDVSASLLSGIGSDKARKAREFAAVIAMLTSSSQDSTGLMLFSDTIEEYLAPSSKRGQFKRIIGALLAQRDGMRTTNIKEAIAHLLRHIKKRSIVFLVSDFYAEPFEDELRLLCHKHDCIGTLILDRIEYDPPPVGLMEVFDAELGSYSVIDTSNEKFRHALKKAQEDRIASLKSLFESAGGDFIVVERDVIKPLS